MTKEQYYEQELILAIMPYPEDELSKPKEEKCYCLIEMRYYEAGAMYSVLGQWYTKHTAQQKMNTEVTKWQDRLEMGGFTKPYREPNGEEQKTEEYQAKNFAEVTKYLTAKVMKRTKIM